MFDKSSLSK